MNFFLEDQDGAAPAGDPANGAPANDAVTAPAEPVAPAEPAAPVTEAPASEQAAPATEEATPPAE
ncbi:MAG: hypothetical protein V2A63_03935 [Patescibacteria group bacterium]